MSVLRPSVPSRRRNRARIGRTESEAATTVGWIFTVRTVFGQQLQKALAGDFAQLGAIQFLQQNGGVEQRLLVLRIELERLVQIGERLRGLALLQEDDAQLRGGVE